MRKIRITSKFRFITFLLIVMIITFVMASQLLLLNTVRGDTIDTYEVVEVESGDTLWSIAEAHSEPNTNIRKFVYEIRQANDLETSDLAVGQKLLIPVEEA